MSGRAVERRTDPTNNPRSKKGYTFQEFIEFYGPGYGHQMWKQGRRIDGGGAAQERRRDPTNPPHVTKTYTKDQFIEFYGPSNGRTMWNKAGKEGGTPCISNVLKRRKNHPLDNAQGVSWSFEYFPPKTDEGVKNLDARMGRMRGMHPEFVDFTWGAGGSTSDLTVDLCKMAQNKHHYIANMHLTCTNMEKGKVEEALKACKENGIRNIVALRGDPPAGEKEWKATDTGFTCALDLIKYIRKETGNHFCLSISGYPEGHPDKIPDHDEYLKTGKIPDEIAKSEMDYLKAKVDAAGDNCIIITQMFYDADKFIEWEKECRKAGIPKHIKILPGVLPIQAYGGFKKMTGFCKTYIPKELADEVEANKPADGLEGDAKKEAEEKFKAFGIRQMTNMCQKLIANGCKHIHFYTLNLDKSCTQILKNLGFVPADYSEETQEGYGEKAKKHPAYLNLPETKPKKAEKTDDKEEKKEEEPKPEVKKD